MTFSDYHARAELYLGSDRNTAMAQGPRSFGTAAQALHFAFEEAAPVSLRGAMLKLGDLTYTGEDLAALYRSPEFPLPRKGDVKCSRARRSRGNRGGSREAVRRPVPQREAAFA